MLGKATLLLAAMIGAGLPAPHGLQADGEAAVRPRPVVAPAPGPLQ